MLNIDKKIDGNKLDLALEGRLDTTTSPQLEQVIQENIDSIDELRIDFTKLEYISSAGLRVLLSTQKNINKKQGKMVVAHPSDAVKDVFELTGFLDILTIE